MKNISALLFVCLLSCKPLVLHGQGLLGKTVDQIRMYASKCSINTFMEHKDTLSFVCQEQDDLGRMFDITYSCIQKGGICVSYTKKIPVHTFWIQRLVEMIDIQETDGEGKSFEVENELFFSQYSFEKCELKLELKGDKLECIYNLYEK